MYKECNFRIIPGRKHDVSQSKRGGMKVDAVTAAHGASFNAKKSASEVASKRGTRAASEGCCSANRRVDSPKTNDAREPPLSSGNSDCCVQGLPSVTPSNSGRCGRWVDLEGEGELAPGRVVLKQSHSDGHPVDAFGDLQIHENAARRPHSGPVAISSIGPLCSDLEQVQQLEQLEQYGIGKYFKSTAADCNNPDNNESNAVTGGSLSELLKSINGSAPLLPCAADRTTTAHTQNVGYVPRHSAYANHSPALTGIGGALLFTPQFHGKGSAGLINRYGGHVGDLGTSWNENPNVRGTFLRTQHSARNERRNNNCTVGSLPMLPIESAQRATEMSAEVVASNGFRYASANSDAEGETIVDARTLR